MPIQDQEDRNPIPENRRGCGNGVWHVPALNLSKVVFERKDVSEGFKAETSAVAVDRIFPDVEVEKRRRKKVASNNGVLVSGAKNSRSTSDQILQQRATGTKVWRERVKEPDLSADKVPAHQARPRTSGSASNIAPMASRVLTADTTSSFQTGRKASSVAVATGLSSKPANVGRPGYSYILVTKPELTGSSLSGQWGWGSSWQDDVTDESSDQTEAISSRPSKFDDRDRDNAGAEKVTRDRDNARDQKVNPRIHPRAPAVNPFRLPFAYQPVSMQKSPLRYLVLRSGARAPLHDSDHLLQAASNRQDWQGRWLTDGQSGTQMLRHWLQHTNGSSHLLRLSHTMASNSAGGIEKVGARQASNKAAWTTLGGPAWGL